MATCSRCNGSRPAGWEFCEQCLVFCEQRLREVPKIKIDTSDPETRAVWNAAVRAREEVASWPAWKRGEPPASDDVEAIVRRLHDEAPHVCDWPYSNPCDCRCATADIIRAAVLAGRAVNSAEVERLRAKIRIADERTEREIAKVAQLRARVAELETQLVAARGGK